MCAADLLDLIQGGVNDLAATVRLDLKKHFLVDQLVALILGVAADRFALIQNGPAGLGGFVNPIGQFGEASPGHRQRPIEAHGLSAHASTSIGNGFAENPERSAEAVASLYLWIIETKEVDMIQSNLAPADLLPDVIATVTAAGSLIRAEFHRTNGPRGSGSHAPIDTDVEEMLKQRLRTLHGCAWLGEETPSIEGTSEDVWVVDPQDGTTDFLAGRRGSAISVALLRQGRPVLGVVHAPVAPDDRGDLIAWAEGSTLTRNGVPVSATENLGHPVVAMNATAPDYAAHNHHTLPGLRIRAIPSPAYRLALAAAGEVGAVISLTRGLEQWDIAGGHALLMGAGGILVDLAGRAIDYRRPRYDGCIGGSSEIVARIVALKPGAGSSDPRKPAQPRKRVSDPLMLSRAQGTLLGQLAGDALGSAVEFCKAADIARNHPAGVTTLEDGGTWDLIAGQPTDDSEMALALGRCLVAHRRFDAAAIGAAYVSWRASRPFDIGGTTAAGIAAIAEGRPARSDSQSNGALMRVSPIGMFAAANPAEAARLAAKDARLTHPHPVCLAASAAYAAAIAAGISGAGPIAMWTAAHDHAGDGPAADVVRARLIAARTGAPEDFEHQIGWVLTAFQNAFYWLMRGAPLAEAVIATVARGGDTDTNGAICGALLGAAQGRDAIPLQWCNAVLTCRPVHAADIKHSRPQTYWPDDALDLAEALLTAADA